MFRLSNNCKYKGATLSQYVIIIALIALALVPLIFFTGQLLIHNFSTFSKCITGSNDTAKAQNQDIFTIKAGQLNGTVNNPVSKCVNKNCSIDYGSFVLNGIPENFNEFVQTGGTSGGEDKLADILMQIAEQYKDKGDPEGYEDYKKFSNLVHIQADLIRILENEINSGLKEKKDFNLLMNKNIASDLKYKLPEALSTTLPGLDLNQQYKSFLFDNCKVDQAVNDIKNNLHPERSKDNNVARAIVDIFNTIQSKKGKYPESLRNLTQELYLNVSQLNYMSTSDIAILSGTEDTKYRTSFDPINGEAKGYRITTNSTVDTFSHPQYSSKQNLTGSIVCTAGKNQAKARSCH